MTRDWRDYRPAIWLAWLGVVVMIVVSPAYIGAIFLGAAIGVAGQIYRRRRSAGAVARAPRAKRPRR